MVRRRGDWRSEVCLGDLLVAEDATEGYPGTLLGSPGKVKSLCIKGEDVGLYTGRRISVPESRFGSLTRFRVESIQPIAIVTFNSKIGLC